MFLFFEINENIMHHVETTHALSLQPNNVQTTHALSLHFV